MIKRLFIQLITSAWLAWFWGLAVLVDMFFITDESVKNPVLLAFDSIVKFSCFLVYTTQAPQHGGLVMLYPFFMQFVFWWVFGFFWLWVFRRLRRKKSTKKLRKK